MGQSQSSNRRLNESFELLQNTFAKVDEEYIEEDTRKCCLYTPRTRAQKVEIILDMVFEILGS